MAVIVVVMTVDGGIGGDGCVDSAYTSSFGLGVVVEFSSGVGGGSGVIFYLSRTVSFIGVVICVLTFGREDSGGNENINFWRGLGAGAVGGSLCCLC